MVIDNITSDIDGNDDEAKRVETGKGPAFAYLVQATIRNLSNLWLFRVQILGGRVAATGIPGSKRQGAQDRNLPCRMNAAFRRAMERRIHAAERYSRRNLSCARRRGEVGLELAALGVRP